MNGVLLCSDTVFELCTAWAVVDGRVQPFIGALMRTLFEMHGRYTAGTGCTVFNAPVVDSKTISARTSALSITHNFGWRARTSVHKG